MGDQLEFNMHIYTCLKQQEFHFDKYQIVPIRFEDKLKILQWRNQQIYHLRQTEKITAREQELYFKKCILPIFEQRLPSQVLFSFLSEGECVGYGGLVRVNWSDRNAEISFLMNTDLERTNFLNYWTIFLKLIEKVAFVEMNLYKIYTYAYDIRPLLFEALKMSEYHQEARLKKHCLIDGIFKDILIHTKCKGQI